MFPWIGISGPRFARATRAGSQTSMDSLQIMGDPVFRSVKLDSPEAGNLNILNINSQPSQPTTRHEICQAQKTSHPVLTMADSAAGWRNLWFRPQRFCWAFRQRDPKMGWVFVRKNPDLKWMKTRATPISGNLHIRISDRNTWPGLFPSCLRRKRFSLLDRKWWHGGFLKWGYSQISHF